jgi:ABC-type nitrate/sulfonate/bicarbonate transport system ATPase subunit
MRVSLARALVTDPSILLLDEPFAALDDMLRGRLCELVLQLHRQQPRTVILVTHNIGEAIFLGHQVAVMDRGMIGGRIEVELPEPRDESLKGTEKFARLYGQVLDRLREARR